MDFKLWSRAALWLGSWFCLPGYQPYARLFHCLLFSPFKPNTRSLLQITQCVRICCVSSLENKPATSHLKLNHTKTAQAGSSSVDTATNRASHLLERPSNATIPARVTSKGEGQLGKRKLSDAGYPQPGKKTLTVSTKLPRSYRIVRCELQAP